MNTLSKKHSFQKMLFENSVPLNIRLRMQARSVSFDKMASIFTKRIWQSYSDSSLESLIVTGVESFCENVTEVESPSFST